MSAKVLTLPVKRNPMQTGYAPRGKAEQRIYTPLVLHERIISKVWRRGIAYDPFPGDGAPFSELAARCCAGDGFVEQLVNRSFSNSPFNRLKEAMEKFRLHADEHRKHELILLGPAQTHRTWFWSCGGDVVAWLRPLAFHGFKQTYPKPLCLHYWGPQLQRFGDVAQASGLAVRVTGATRL